MTRPAVSVVVPFRGGPGDAMLLLEALARLELRSGDELAVVDNSPRPIVQPSGTAEVLRAPLRASSYYARNVGAGRAANDWLLFLDADTSPPPDLLDAYFAEPLPVDSGIVAGEVDGAPEQTALTARHARSRQHLGVEAHHLSLAPGPAAGTANLLVRRQAWEELGGFHEVRSGADLEFCWRAQEVGWTFAHRPAARVEHRHAETLGSTLRKVARYGPGRSWSDRRYPGGAPRPQLIRQVARAIAGLVAWPLAGRFERAAFKALDGAWVAAYSWGYYLGDNRAQPLDPDPSRRRPHPDEGAALEAEAFPSHGDPLVDRALELAARGQLAGVIAVRRPERVDRRALEAPIRASYFEDLGPAERLRAGAWLLLHRPHRGLAALLRRGRSPALVGWRVRESARLGMDTRMRTR